MAIAAGSDRKRLPGYEEHINERAHKEARVKQSDVLFMSATGVGKLVLILFGSRIAMMIQVGYLIGLSGEECGRCQHESYPSI